MIEKFIKKCISNNEMYKFYKSEDWINLRNKIMTEQHNECFECKKNGIYKKADIVHHIKHVRNYPNLALSRKFIDDDGILKDNLICLCHACHEREHKKLDTYRLKKNNNFENEEKW